LCAAATDTPVIVLTPAGSAIEDRLLCQLAQEPSRVFTRNELMTDAWDYATTGCSRTLTVTPAGCVQSSPVTITGWW
jgi:hypothetical protein